MDKDKRKKENDNLIERMKKGEDLSRISPEATWYPPRPQIKKDLSKLYQLKDKSDED